MTIEAVVKYVSLLLVAVVLFNCSSFAASISNLLVSPTQTGLAVKLLSVKLSEKPVCALISRLEKNKSKNRNGKYGFGIE